MSDHRNRTAFGRNVSFLARRERPRYSIRNYSSSEGVARYREGVGAWNLGFETYLASLVLSDLVLGVLAAVLALAVGLAGFRNVDLDEISSQPLPYVMLKQICNDSRFEMRQVILYG